MNAAPTPWKVAYYGGWMGALAGLFAVLAQWVVTAVADPQFHSDDGWGLGAILGVVFGPLVAYTTRDSLAWHRVVRWLGRFVCVAGLGGAVVMFLMSDSKKHEQGIFLGGLVEFVLAVFALLLAAIGGCAWLAGASGARLAAVQPTAGGSL